MALPWVTRYIQATGILMLGVAAFVVVWTILYQSGLRDRIVATAFAAIFGAFGIRRLRLAKRALSN